MEVYSELSNDNNYETQEHKWYSLLPVFVLSHRVTLGAQTHGSRMQIFQKYNGWIVCLGLNFLFFTN